MRCTRGIVSPLKQPPPTQMKRRLTKKIGPTLRSATLLFGATLALHVLAGCMSVGVEDRQSVSRPNTEFSRTAVDGHSSKITPQIQPGLAVSGGAQASTCTSCR